MVILSGGRILDKENTFVVTDKWKKSYEGMKKFHGKIRRCERYMWRLVEDEKFLQFIEQFGIYPIYEQSLFEDILPELPVTLGYYIKDIFSDKSNVVALEVSEIVSLIYLYEKSKG